MPVESSSLRQGTDALGAERLLDHATVLHYRNLLEVRLVSPVGFPVGEGYIVSESCGFSTMSALSHLELPFLRVACFESG